MLFSHMIKFESCLKVLTSGQVAAVAACRQPPSACNLQERLLPTLRTCPASEAPFGSGRC